MDTSNHTGKGTSRVYWLTRPGQRLAAYLDYVDSHPVAADIQFGDVRPPAPPQPVPEEYDDDRQPDTPTCTNCGRPLNDKGLCWHCDAPSASAFFDDGYDDSEDDDPDDFNPYGEEE